MNKQHYDALDSAQKLIATEAYIEGFQACIEQVSSMKIRTGDLGADALLHTHLGSINAILLDSFENLIIDWLVQLKCISQ
jgi:hypothetical protein